MFIVHMYIYKVSYLFVRWAIWALNMRFIFTEAVFELMAFPGSYKVERQRQSNII